MAQRRLSAVALALLVILAPSSLPAGAGAVPAIRFAQTDCDLGSLAQGELPSCTFTFDNGGDVDLVILEVEPSCGCTTTLLSVPRVPPGGTGALRATFDSANFAGDLAKEIAVRSNDPDRPEVTLTLRARVEPEVDFEPREIVFAAPAAGSESRAVVVLVNRRAEAVFVRSIAAEPSSFRCRIPAWQDEGEPFRVESWDRVPIEVVDAPLVPAVMPAAGRCTLIIEGPRKREFVLKLLALP